MRFKIIIFLVLFYFGSYIGNAMNTEELSFYLPFDNSYEPVIPNSDDVQFSGSPSDIGGIFAGAVQLGSGSFLSYPLQGNFDVDSGSCNRSQVKKRFFDSKMMFSLLWNYDFWPICVSGGYQNAIFRPLFRFKPL